MLKNLPRSTLYRITNLTNAILRLQHFPSSWKNSIIIPIHNPGKDPFNPTNYRPMSLLSSLSKVVKQLSSTDSNQKLRTNSSPTNLDSVRTTQQLPNSYA
ncbi:hypothetical protein AVEN_56211-1 [Araneus ventricosus]|uniref:RNA-directed DNA polymerase from transposon X-element n=1 Tax=Araneus ventricosus TaxID=182803 RepID=A0A4Y2NZB9_ARAVE|nr:hypothetical protein AVEN_56211-1 [Araneus ventricosus]